MEKLDCTSRKNPPQHLYHYTSIVGLKGILESRSIWATMIYFLNDLQEFKYATTILEEVLSERQAKLPQNVLLPLALSPPGPYTPGSKEEALFRLYRFLIDMLSSDLYEKIPICVFSLSEWGDLLSQWRGYCPCGGGYSVGFRSDSLTLSLQPRNLTLVPCVYDQAKQKILIESEVTKLERDYLDCHPMKDFNEVMAKISGRFLVDFSRKAPTIKHPSFREECEWRIISRPIPPKDLEFHVGKSILIPHFPIRFEATEPFPIDEIIVGPAPEQSLAVNSLKSYILNKGLSFNSNVKISEIPYREL
jgi:hypothetical protein